MSELRHIVSPKTYQMIKDDMQSTGIWCGKCFNEKLKLGNLAKLFIKTSDDYICKCETKYNPQGA